MKPCVAKEHKGDTAPSLHSDMFVDSDAVRCVEGYAAWVLYATYASQKSYIQVAIAGKKKLLVNFTASVDHKFCVQQVLSMAHAKGQPRVCHSSCDNFDALKETFQKLRKDLVVAEDVE